MRRDLVLATACLGPVVLAAGCVQQDVHSRSLIANRTKTEQIRYLQEELDAANVNLTAAKAEIVTLQSQVGDLESAIAAETLESEGWMKRLSETGFGALPLDVEMALDQLAGSHPQLLSFERERGVLRFSADLSFDSGSAHLRPEAREAIAPLARLLVETMKDEPFEVRLIGHTDNVPVERHDTRQRHPTNVHLSVHRAISVRDALAAEGVDPARMLVAGYGEFHPLVPNGPKGAAENRRVELLLVPVVAARPEPEEVEVIEPYLDVPSK